MDSATLTALRLARLGAGGYGTPQQILDASVGLVLDMIEHAKFMSEFEETAAELNKEKK